MRINWKELAFLLVTAILVFAFLFPAMVLGFGYGRGYPDIVERNDELMLLIFALVLDFLIIAAMAIFELFIWTLKIIVL